MSHSRVLHAALRRIANYNPGEPYNEWTLAKAFHQLQQIASDALNPAERVARIAAARKHDQDERNAVRALRKDREYFIPGHGNHGLWVRFIGGSARKVGVVRVRLVDKIDDGTSWQYLKRGMEFEVNVGNIEKFREVGVGATKQTGQKS